MAESIHKTPTAANIISSLGVKGAISSIPAGEDASKYEGFLPVLDANGRLNAKFIPPEVAQISIPTLSNVAYVDPYTSIQESSLRVGSIVAPFKSIKEAAANFKPTDDAKSSKYIAFVLAPGKYEDTKMQFSPEQSPLSVYLIGTGNCIFASNITTFLISGMSSASGGRRPRLFLQNIYMAGEIAVDVFSGADTFVIGKTYVHQLSVGSESNLSIASDCRVDSTDAGTVVFLSEDSRIGNTSGVKGDTVKDAVGRLGRRKVRIPKITTDSSGLDINSSSFIDISETSSSGDSFGVFDLRVRDRVLVESINRLFERSKNVVADSVSAKTVVADSVSTKELRMDSLALGGYRVEIDLYGYLVVSDRSATPPKPPDSVVLLRDTVDGAIYTLGVSNGRMYIAEADDGSSSSAPVEVMTVYDQDSGTEYTVSVEDGRLVIKSI
jgi:hypothetical protein